MKTRRASGKLKAVKYVVDDTEDDDNDNAMTYEDEDISDDEPMLLKRRRLTDDNVNEFSKAVGSPASKGKGNDKVYRGKNVGKLAKLLEMPVDIFCEITVYLEPLDLLRLARSTREFNKMLMSRSSKPIWRTARNYYADLPDCPPDLSEPEYARLLFERDCHVCLAPRVQKVDYALRARLCHRCRSSNIVRGTQLLKTIPHLTEELLECIPCRNQRYQHGYRRLAYFYRARVEKLVADFRAAVPQDAPADQAWALKKAFCDSNKALIEPILEHASNVDQWLLLDRTTKQEEAEDAAARRKAKITAKVMELGYSKDDFPTEWEDEESEWDKIMDQPRDLTPRIWANVRPKLEDMIQKVKSRREESARDHRQTLRINEVRVLLTMPSIERQWPHIDLEDIMRLPTVEAMVSEDDWQHEVTRERWDAAWTQIEQEMDDRTNQFKKELMRLFIRPRQLPESSCASQVAYSALSSDSASAEAEDIDFTVLSSVTTFFECTACTGLSQYPDVLGHRHGWISEWKSEGFTVGTATRLAESLLASAPQQYGYENLKDGLGNLKEKKFLCLRCDESLSWLNWPMTWTELVRHFMDKQKWYDGQLEFQRMSSLGSMSSVQDPLHNDHSLDAGAPVFAILSNEQNALQEESRDGSSELPSYSAGLF